MRLPQGCKPLPIFETLFADTTTRSSSSSSSASTLNYDHTKDILLIDLLQFAIRVAPGKLKRNAELAAARVKQAQNDLDQALLKVADITAIDPKLQENLDFQKEQLLYINYAQDAQQRHLKPALVAWGYAADTDVNAIPTNDRKELIYTTAVQSYLKDRLAQLLQQQEVAKATQSEQKEAEAAEGKISPDNLVPDEHDNSHKFEEEDEEEDEEEQEDEDTPEIKSIKAGLPGVNQATLSNLFAEYNPNHHVLPLSTTLKYIVAADPSQLNEVKGRIEGKRNEAAVQLQNALQQEVQKSTKKAGLSARPSKAPIATTATTASVQKSTTELQAEKDFYQKQLDNIELAAKHLGATLVGWGYEAHTQLKDIPSPQKELICLAAVRSNLNKRVAQAAPLSKKIIEAGVSFSNLKSEHFLGETENLKLQCAELNTAIFEGFFHTYDPTQKQELSLTSMLEVAVAADAEQLKAAHKRISEKLESLKSTTGEGLTHAAKAANHASVAEELQIKFYNRQLRCIQYAQRAKPQLRIYLEALGLTEPDEEKNGTLLTSAKKALDFSKETDVHAAPFKSEKEKRVTLLTAVKCVLDAKLKQLVTDPRTSPDVDKEIAATKAELVVVNAAINTLLGLKQDDVTSPQTGPVVVKREYSDLKQQWLTGKEQHYETHTNHLARLALDEFHETDLTTRLKRVFVAHDAHVLVLDAALERIDREIGIRESVLNPTAQPTFLYKHLDENKNKYETDPELIDAKTEQQNIKAVRAEYFALHNAAVRIRENGAINAADTHESKLRDYVLHHLKLSDGADGLDDKLAYALVHRADSIYEYVHQQIVNDTTLKLNPVNEALATHFNLAEKDHYVASGDNDTSFRKRAWKLFKQATGFENAPKVAFEGLEIIDFPLVFDVAIKRINKSIQALNDSRNNSLKDGDLGKHQAAVDKLLEVERENITKIQALRTKYAGLIAAQENVYVNHRIDFVNQDEQALRPYILKALNLTEQSKNLEAKLEKYLGNHATNRLEQYLSNNAANIRTEVREQLTKAAHAELKQLDPELQKALACAEVEYRELDAEYGRKWKLDGTGNLIDRLSKDAQASHTELEKNRKAKFEAEFQSESVITDEAKEAVLSTDKDKQDFANYKRLETDVLKLRDIHQKGDFNLATWRALQFTVDTGDTLQIKVVPKAGYFNQFIGAFNAAELELNPSEIAAIKKAIRDKKIQLALDAEKEEEGGGGTGTDTGTGTSSGTLAAALPTSSPYIAFNDLPAALQALLQAKKLQDAAIKPIRDAIAKEYGKKADALEKLKSQPFYAKLEEYRETVKARALSKVLVAESNYDTAEREFWFSRFGKTIAILYVISQVVGLGFMGLIMVFAIGTASPVFIPALVFLGLCMGATGVSNWWVFRGNTPKLLITLYNLFMSPTDVPYTLTQYTLLIGSFIFCCAVSGFVTGFIFYVMVMSGGALAIETLGLVATLAVVSPLLPYVIIPLLVIVAIGAFIGITLIFYSGFHAMILRENTWNDIKSFYTSLVETNKQAINDRLEASKNKLRDRYQHYYQGRELEKKINDEVSDSVVGIILAKNLADAEKGATARIWVRGIILGILVTVLVPGIIIGAIYAQVAGHPKLRELLDTTIGFSYIVAEVLSWMLCTLAGLAYAPLFSYGATKCMTDLACGVAKSASNDTTWSSRIWFQCVRLGNTIENAGQTLFGACMALASVFADGLKLMLASAGLAALGIGSVFNSAFGSFITNTIQGAMTRFYENFIKAKEDRGTAMQVMNAQEEPVVIEAKLPEPQTHGYQNFIQQQRDERVQTWVKPKEESPPISSWFTRKNAETAAEAVGKAVGEAAVKVAVTAASIAIGANLS